MHTFEAHPLFYHIFTFPNKFGTLSSAYERILISIRQGRRMIVANLRRIHTDILQCLIECFSIMSEHHCTMVREVLSDQPVTIETSHLMDGEDTDAAKALCCNRKDFTLSRIGAEFVVCCGLQSVEGDFARLDIALDRSVAPVLRMGSWSRYFRSGSP